MIVVSEPRLTVTWWQRAQSKLSPRYDACSMCETWAFEPEILFVAPAFPPWHDSQLDGPPFQVSAVPTGAGKGDDVVVPAFNEESRIDSGLTRIIEFLADADRSAEIIVVDDGSQDSTFQLAEKALSQSGLPHQILVNETNRGKGLSVRRGVLAARGRLVLFTDTDLSTPIEEFLKLEEAVARGADVAIGSRDAVGAEVIRHQ